MKIYPYNTGSASAKALSQALGTKLIRHTGKLLRVKGSIINWGCSALQRDMRYTGEMINLPNAVARAVNKIESFKAMEGHTSIPEWTESLAEAEKWLNDGYDVVCRHKLTGHSGEGIEIISSDIPIIPAVPLYVKYIKKLQEYHLHVHKGQVFFVQRKARNKGVPDDQVNWQVRNHANGFIFANQDVDVDDVAKQYAISAVNALGLHFGAVDIIYSSSKQWYVLEINTACGLMNSTLERYVEQFKEYV